jgi:D-serine dehydratase
MTLKLEPDFFADGSLKGFPTSLGRVHAREIGGFGLEVLKQEVEFPVALLKSSALRHNQLWMRAFLARTGASIAPHGKTTMSPELIAMQIADGAWGITAATPAHIRSYQAHGVRRIIHANQLVGKENIRGVFELLAQDAELDFYTLVDSRAGFDLLADGLARTPIGRPLQLLLEIGAENGRTGFRVADDAMALAEDIALHPRFVLAGVGCFEGVYSGRSPDHDHQAGSMIDRMVELALHLSDRKLFGISRPIFSAGGSAYFGLVARTADEHLKGADFRVVLRSGCYLTHDSEHYRLIHQRLGLAEEVALPDHGLLPALEVWGCVQSRPEPGLVLVNLGKRDISHDIDLPVPLWTCGRKETQAIPSGPDMTVQALNDQHLFLLVAPESTLAVGDLVGFGISHPCTTFDKWKAMFVVDDAYRVESMISTCF